MGASGADIGGLKKSINLAMAQGTAGQLTGLQMAAPFFGALGSTEATTFQLPGTKGKRGLMTLPGLAGTPLGQSFQAQQGVFNTILGQPGGLPTGLPPDAISAISEGLTSQFGALGTTGSPATALSAAMRFSGASEAIRSSRIEQAMKAIQGLGAGSIAPGASEFLSVSSGLAGQKIGALQNIALMENQQAQQQNQQWGQIAGIAAGGLLGGFGGIGASFGLGGGFLPGFGLGSGLLPSGLFGRRKGVV